MLRTHQKLSNESFPSLWTERTCIHLLLSTPDAGDELWCSMKCAWWDFFSMNRQIFCLYMSYVTPVLNTLCRWLTIMDITLCLGFSTDGTTLCCRHVINSWQSTLKNIHVVNTCPYDDFHYDLILAYSIYVKQISSLTTLMIIVHGSAVQESTKDHMTNNIKNAFLCCLH